MNIQVMNRQEAIQYCHQRHDEETCIISIYTPVEEYHDEPFMSTIIGNGVYEILRVGFFDVDLGNKGAIDKDMADMIADTVERNKNRKIIVHCDLGASRSVGVAAALAKFYNNDDMEYFNTPNMIPNMRCYRYVLNALVKNYGLKF